MRAVYAKREEESLGRVHEELGHEFRNCFQRDRDRIIHSKAFRQLEGKTQVFVHGSAYRIRTRLTHTIEVTAIARTIARALQVNEDLVETIALAHDLGHPPFGHGGERSLNTLMGHYGGFDHNLQTLRIVDLLEMKYPKFRGLNLTWETRAGLVKHRENHATLDGVELTKNCSIEGQIVNLADNLTYIAHDIDDGLELGILKDSLLQENNLWSMARGSALADGAEEQSSVFLPFTIRCFINNAVKNVINESRRQLNQLSPESAEAIEVHPTPIVGFSDNFADGMNQIKKFLFNHIYLSEDVVEATNRSTQMLEALFLHYCDHPEKLIKTYRSNIENFGLERTICDQLAYCTDFEVETLFNDLFKRSSWI
jgi:dGTPase